MRTANRMESGLSYQSLSACPVYLPSMSNLPRLLLHIAVLSSYLIFFTLNLYSRVSARSKHLSSQSKDVIYIPGMDNSTRSLVSESLWFTRAYIGYEFRRTKDL